MGCHCMFVWHHSAARETAAGLAWLQALCVLCLCMVYAAVTALNCMWGASVRIYPSHTLVRSVGVCTCVQRLLEDGSDDFIASMSVALTRFVTQLAKVQAMHLGGDGRHSVSDKGGGRVAAGSAQGSDSGGAGDGSAGSQHTPLAALGLGQFSEQDLARVRGGMEGLELVLRREGVLVKLQSGASGAPDSKGRSSKGDGDEEDEYEEDGEEHNTCKRVAGSCSRPSVVQRCRGGECAGEGEGAMKFICTCTPATNT